MPPVVPVVEGEGEADGNDDDNNLLQEPEYFFLDGFRSVF
jgi:hypothetical protein